MFKLVSRVLAVIGVLALSVTTAHAGGGLGGGGPTMDGFQCYVLDRTVNQPYVVGISDQFFPETLDNGTVIPGRQHVRVGNGRVLCAPATVTFESGPDSAGGQFDEAGFGGDHLKCYTILPLVRGPNATVELLDPMDAETAKVVGSPFLLCVSAHKTPVP